MWNPLVLTTLLHYAAFPAATVVGCLYGAIVVSSTTASVIWHGGGEPPGILSAIDHGLAAIWNTFDLLYSWQVGEWVPVLLANIFIIGTHSAVEVLAKKGVVPYRVGHSVWHVGSALKAWWVAGLLSGCCGD